MRLIQNDNIILNKTLSNITIDNTKRVSYESNVKPYLDMIRTWAKLGATNKEIARALGIGASTFNDYKKKHPELIEALRAGAREVVLEVKASLLRQALGYKERETRVIKRGEKIVSTEVYERYYPPNERACAMILRNYDDKFIEKGLDVNIQNMNEELSKIGNIVIEDDIKASLERETKDEEKETDK